MEVLLSLTCPGFISEPENEIRRTRSSRKLEADFLERQSLNVYLKEESKVSS